jgi:cold shock protein
MYIFYCCKFGLFIGQNLTNKHSPNFIKKKEMNKLFQVKQFSKFLRSFHSVKFSYSPKGTVKWFNSEKGYGFIVQETGKDLFAHISGLANDNMTLNEGDAVEYEMGQGRQGPVATKIRVISKGETTTQKKVSDSEDSGSDVSSDSDSETDRKR